MSQLFQEAGAIHVIVTCPHCGIDLPIWAPSNRYNRPGPVLVSCGSDEMAGCGMYMAVILSLTTSAEVFTLEATEDG